MTKALRIQAGARAALAAAVLVCGAHQSHAQAQSGTTVPGLRGSELTTPPGQSLIIDGAASSGFDTLVASDATNASLFTRDTRASALSTSLVYTLGAGWVSSRVNVASAGRYFDGSGAGWSFVNYGGADLGVAIPISQRTRLATRASASYQPVSATTLFPDLFRTEGPPPLPTEFDLSTPLDAYVESRVGVDLFRALSRASSVTVGYGRLYRGPLSGNAAQNSDSAYGRFGRTLTRWMGLRLGYEYAARRRAGGALPDGTSATLSEERRIDFGVDIRKSLRFSRRTTLSISSGTAALSDGRDTRFGLVGSVDLSHEFKRTWRSGLTYHRRAEFMQVFAQPTFADSITGSIEGQPFSRVAVTGGTGASWGRLGLSSTANSYRAAQAAVGASINLTRLFSIRADYAYYRFRFATSELLPLGIGSRVHRHHFQIGTGLNLPLLGQQRRANASR